MISKMKISEFDKVFEIMDKSFPNSEMRDYDGQKKLLSADKDIYSIYVERNGNNDVIGFIAFWELTDFTYIEHFAVDEKCRGKNIGEKMLNEFVKAQSRPVVLEVEYPEDDFSIRRIGFYKRNNFIMNEYKYLQPPTRVGNDFLPLKIMSSPRAITEQEFLTLNNDLYTKVYKYKK